MNITFLIPNNIKGINPERNFGCFESIYEIEDLTVMYMAAVLEKAGHNIDYYEFRADQFTTRSISKSDILMVHSVYLSADYDIQLGKKIKDRPVFFFGPSPSLNPEKFISKNNHYVIRGETEHVLIDAINHPEKTNSISYFSNKKIIHNKSAGIIENLDLIPFPLRQNNHKKHYNPKLNYKNSTIVLSSRGCANRCYFCVPNSISWAREIEWKRFHSGKPPVKARSAKNVITEIKLLSNLGYEEFSFIDDQFIFGKDRILEICLGIKKLKMNYGILARSDRLLDETIVKALYLSGCRYVDIGVESFNQNILDDIKKDLKTEAIYKSIKLLNKYQIKPKLNIMFGTSSKENDRIINQTINKSLSLPVKYCMYSIATPFAGTEFNKIAERKGWLKKKQNKQKIDYISYPHLSNKRLHQIYKKAYCKFYLRPKVLLYHINKIRSLRSLKVFVISVNNFIKSLK